MTDSHGKKRIVHLLYSGVGGHGNVFMNLVKADKKMEFDYFVIFFGIEPIRNAYVEFCHQENIPFQYRRKKEGIDVWFFVKLFLSIKKVKPDVIFLHGSYTIIPAWVCKVLFGSRIIVRETQANHLKTKVDFLTLKLAISLADAMVFLTAEFKDEIYKKFNIRRNSKKLSVISNGLDLNQYDVNRDYKKAPKVISMVSRLVPIKDHLTLIDAFVEVNKTEKGVRLKIAGSGISESAIRSKIKELELENVELVGELDEQEITELLAQSDIYIHPTFGETMSTSLMQAMASGLPIISSKVPGVVNMICDKKTGVLVETKQPEVLAKTIVQLLNSEFERGLYGMEAKKYARENFSSGQMFEKYKRLNAKA